MLLSQCVSMEVALSRALIVGKLFRCKDMPGFQEMLTSQIAAAAVRLRKER